MGDPDLPEFVTAAAPVAVSRGHQTPSSSSGQNVLAASALLAAGHAPNVVTPLLLGGGRVFVLSKLVYQNITELNWPLGAVQAFVLLTMALLILVVSSRLNRATYAARESSRCLDDAASIRSRSCSTSCWGRCSSTNWPCCTVTTNDTRTPT